MKKQIVKYFLLIYLVAIIAMAFIRLILFVAVKDFPVSVEERGLVWEMFERGWAFDSLITCYILILPVVFLLFYSFFTRIYSDKIWKWISTFIVVMFVLVFALMFINIPYFKYNNSPLSSSAFEYMKYFKTTMAMVLTETSYWIYFGMFIVFCLGIVYVIRLITRKTVWDTQQQVHTKKYPFVLLFLVLGFLCFIGMRGTLKRYPLRVSYASYSTNSLFNKMTLNPVFYLIKNIEKQSKGFYMLGKLVNADEAYKEVQKEWGITPKSQRDLAREVNFQEVGNKANIVIILSESLSIEHLKIKRNDGSPLMPFLEDLKQKSYYFDNFYSAANHTNNGILATLYGMPTIFNRPSLQNKDNFYTGLPFYLKQHGYSNYFFITGNPHYDNMNGFLYSCGSIDKVYSLDDYPREKEVNNFGVADDFLFEFGIEELNKNAKKSPFFATFLTVSNHPPYVIPEKYKNNNEPDSKRIMMFVDDTLKEFFSVALQQPWAKNTIFILLGDHGSVLGDEKLPMPLSYNHIPMMVYSELFKDKAQVFSQFGGQVDVFPTVMGMLKLSYINNTFGIDLFREKRESMFFVSDTHLGCINEEFLYTYDLENKTQGLFQYKSESTQNKENEYPELTRKMKTYGFSMMKVAEEEILKK